jgi:hypothetical protein
MINGHEIVLDPGRDRCGLATTEKRCASMKKSPRRSENGAGLVLLNGPGGDQKSSVNATTNLVSFRLCPFIPAVLS